MSDSEQAQAYYHQGYYDRAAIVYEQLLEQEPEVKSHYWQLGLMLLLQGKIEEAQSTWLMAILEGDSVEEDNQALVQTLQAAAQQQETKEQWELARSIRASLQEIQPTDINNIFALIALDFQLQKTPELASYGLKEILETNPKPEIDFPLLNHTLAQILDKIPYDEELISILEMSLNGAKTLEQKAQLALTLYNGALDIGYFHRQPETASRLCELAWEIDQSNPDILNYLASFYQDHDQFEKGIATAKLYADLVTNLPDRVFANKGLLKAFMVTGGHWEQALTTFTQHQTLIQQLLTENPPVNGQQVSRLFNAYFFAPYFRDEPERDRPLQNQLATFCAFNTRLTAPELVEKYAQRHALKRNQSPHKKLKIGYLSYCFKSHSVGWLARALIQHHDRENFTINGYFLTSPDFYEPLQDWYVSQFDKSYKSKDAIEMAEAIYNDDIDILIELDSITLDTTCCIVSLKPAPIQVTWLGWDASGNPAIDYYIGDPHVLPETAQNYYQEKIWRLPETYLAVNGFEASIPTLRRDKLEIEPDAVIYYSVQKGFKRNIDTMRLQLQIIKQVPHSYFLIKGASDTKAMKKAFLKLAQEEDVSPDRLRFLDVDLTEAIHRANLGEMDIVLDTYPYNGATTTMETLWMGVPLVTRVGAHFSSRNSYTMLINAGITEGIAWSAAAYVEWGMRFGLDYELRQQVAWKLKKSRQIAPLWNGERFARQMEKAYQEMWQIYLEKR